MKTCVYLEAENNYVHIRCTEEAVNAQHGFLCQQHLWADQLRLMQRAAQKAPKRDLEIEQLDGIIRGDLRKINRGTRVSVPVCLKSKIKISYLE